jgi:hypothetical protein
VSASLPSRSILQFISNHSPDAATGAFLLSGTTHLGYLAYDWTLNDRFGNKP